MTDDPFRTARGYLSATPAARWGAMLASAVASVCLVLLLPLLYLFVDLLVYQGRLPADLPDDARQALIDQFPAAAGPDAEVGILSLAARERDRWTASVVTALARALPWTAGPSNYTYLVTLFVLAAGLNLARGLLVNLASYGSAVATIDAGARLRRALYTHGQRLSAVAVRPDAQAEAGELVSRRVDDVQDGMTASLGGAVRTPLVVVLVVALLVATHFWLTVVVLAVTGLVWLVAGSAAAWFRRDARVAGRRAEARLGMIRESIGGLQLAKAYLMERFGQTRFERHLTDLSRSTWRRQRGDTFSQPTLLTVVGLAALAVLFLAGRVVLGGDMTVAALAVKAAAIATLVVALGRWLAVRVRVRRAAAAAADIFEFLARRADVAQTVDAEFLQPMTRRLEFVDVSLREPGTGRMVLENVSFIIPAGGQTAVLAADPADAHALAHLVTRFVDPTAGEVRIDGKNTRWVTFESVRTQVALVLESALTFSDTVANNIGCGDPVFTPPQIIEAAKLAHAHQFVQRLPYGYETRIGTAGMMLSPGEQFRVALARALLRDPSLLIIEEPAAGLDADSLVLIDDTLTRAKAGRTILFLARRPATVRAADRVIVLRHGRLAAAGSHDELLESSELYRQLHFKQTLAAGTG